MSKPRLFYLDNLKAFAILAVIASHVNSFVFSNGGCFMNKAIDTFFMGTFFMVSGYLGHRAFTEKVSMRKFFEVKTYNLLIPLLVVGTIYVLCHDLATNGRITVNPLLKMITNGDQMGYWFLLTLFVFKIMALITGVLTNTWNRMRCRTAAPLTQLLVFVLLGGVISVLSTHIVGSNELWHMCFTGHILYYMLFYIAGAMMHRLNLFTKLQQQDALIAVMFVLGIVLFVLYHFEDLGHPLLFITSYRMCIVVPLFVYFSKFIDKPIRRFTTFGIHSLELYVLHYFVIIGCSDYSAPWISEVSRLPFLFQLGINLIITYAIAAFTLSLARVVDNNSTMRTVVLGKL